MSRSIKSRLPLVLTILVLVSLAVAGCRAPDLEPVESPRKLELPKKAPDLGTIIPRGGGTVGIVLIGSDKREGVEGQRADALMYVVISAKKKKMTMLSFPRDSYVAIPGRGRNKINASLQYGGPKLTARTVERYLGLPVDYYVVGEFTSFKRVVNKLGGIPVELERSIRDTRAKADIPAGRSVLDGAQALGMARARYTVPGGDFGRAANQQRIVAAAQRAFLRENKDPDLAFLVSLVREDFKTDMPALTALSTAQTLRNIPPENVERVVLPGGIGTAGGASVVILSSSEVKRIAKRVQTEFDLQ